MTLHLRVLGLAFTVLVSKGEVQSDTPSSLNELLAKLTDDQKKYVLQIPSFSCDEHVVSRIRSGDNRQVETTDSIFRLTRQLPPQAKQDAENGRDGLTLMESREVTAINGSPAGGNQTSGPMTLTGAFSNGLAVVSQDQEPCMNYTMDTNEASRAGKGLLIRFSTKDLAVRSGKCLVKESASGTALVDPATFRLSELTLTFPHHADPILGEVSWFIDVKYSSIRLADKTFWLPQNISSTAASSELDGKTVASFVANYTNYRKMEVHSRVLAPLHPQ